MKFPRNAKVFRGQLDVAAFAGVFFALCLMLVFSTLLVHSPGVEIQLPEVLDARVQGVEPPVINVAVDAQGTIYFESQIIERASFKNRLSHVVAQFENHQHSSFKGTQTQISPWSSTFANSHPRPA